MKFFHSNFLWIVFSYLYNLNLSQFLSCWSQEGFSYHHAEPKHLMLVRWIPETTNTLPANASHRVGIGAFVMTEKGEVRCLCSLWPVSVLSFLIGL